MSTINRLSSVDALQPGDLIPVWDGSNGDTRKASLTTLLAFIESNFADPDYSTRIVAPTTDYFTVDIGATGDSIWMIVNPVLNFTTGTITLPSTAYAVNDQEITVVFTAAVVNFSITSSGATVLGAPATINNYDSFRVRYNASQQTWYTLDTTGDGSGVSQIIRQDFTGNGTTTTFTLTTAPSALGNELQIFIDGVYQQRAGYAVTGSNIVFSEAPPSLSTIEVLGWSVSVGEETSSNLVSYTPAGTGAVLTTVQEKLRESISITDFGASTEATATVNSAAIQAAITYAHSLGGGVVHVPFGSYLIAEIDFGTAYNVTLEGELSGVNYGSSVACSTLNCYAATGAVFGIRLPIDGSYCGLKNIAVQSDGLVDTTTAPYGGSSGGVEYGVLIETGVTLMEGVTVYGFQHGCALTNAGNSNVFDGCTFLWNTKSGFSCTVGTSAAYDLYHPNLTYPSTFIVTTVFTMRNCIMRRNGWGMILRDGGGTFTNTVIESNVHGGLLQWVGSLDGGVSGTWYNCYFENNWLNFDPALDWSTASQTGNTLLLNQPSIYIVLDDNASNALSDYGYQIIMGGATAGNSQGPGYQNFYNTSMSHNGVQKSIFIKQGFKNFFRDGGSVGGDQTNAIRLGYATGGFAANATHFFDWNGTLPTDYSNRGAAFNAERSADTGGITAIEGHFRGLAGNVLFPATQVPSADVNELDDYQEGTFAPGLEDQSGHADSGYNGQIGEYVKVGRLVHCKVYVRSSGTMAGVVTTEMLRVTGLPFPVGVGGNQVPAFVNLTNLAPSTYLGLFGLTYTGQTYLNIFAVGGAGSAPYGPTPFTVGNFENGNASEIFLNFTYTAAS